MHMTDAWKLVEAGVEAAALAGVQVAVAVYDTGGNPVAFARMDGCSLAGLDSAAGKAYTAAATGASTAVLATLVGPGEPLFGLAAAVQYPRPLVPLPGGAALHDDELLVGGVGVGGAPSSDVDQSIADQAVATVRFTQDH